MGNKICPICGDEFDGKTVHCSKKCGYITVSRKKKQAWESKEYRDEMKVLMSSGDYKDKMSEIVKTRFENEEYCKKHSASVRKVTSTKAYKEKLSKITTENWKNPEYAKKCLLNGRKYKKYKMPSGKTVKIQGYENFALDLLLKKYNEDDIFISFEMFKIIPYISYNFKNKSHRYYPDIFIKSTNTIIEVKSNWTFELHKDMNIAKKQACISEGYNFEFLIF